MPFAVVKRGFVRGAWGLLDNTVKQVKTITNRKAAHIIALHTFAVG
jgi:hypothetical protein